jgi:HAMP domain-containing protein
MGLAFGFWLPQRRTSKSLQLALALTCLWVLLFPVISATDDLHVMRQEAEESSSAKETLKQATHHGSRGRDCSALPALLSPTLQAAPCSETWGNIPVLRVAAPLSVWTTNSLGRAPPTSLLA